MEVRLKFRKAPLAKNYMARSISFSPEELEHVKDSDPVEIEVSGRNSSVIINTTGKELRENLIPKKIREKEFLVFKF